LSVMIEAIGIILVADVTLVIAFLAHISSKYTEYIRERRELLDKKLKAKICESDTEETTIDTFLPLFEEHEKIEGWRRTLKQILSYLGYSAVLSMIGLVFYLLGSVVTIGDIPVEFVFVVSSGFYLIFGLGVIIKHHIEVNEWRLSKNR